MRYAHGRSILDLDIQRLTDCVTNCISKSLCRQDYAVGSGLRCVGFLGHQWSEYTCRIPHSETLLLLKSPALYSLPGVTPPASTSPEHSAPFLSPAHRVPRRFEVHCSQWIKKYHPRGPERVTRVDSVEIAGGTQIDPLCVARIPRTIVIAKLAGTSHFSYYYNSAVPYLCRPY